MSLRLHLPDPPLPLLVTGIAGVAGYNAFDYFHRRYPGRVIGTRRAGNVLLSGPAIEGCDIYDADAMQRLFDRYQFASVLSCEGTCALKSCELDPWLAWRVNVAGVDNLLEVIGTAAVRLIHLSVDLVYSGNGRGGYVEHDPPDPVTIYGKTMSQAERLILSWRPDAAILRISLPMGISSNGHAGAIDWIQSRFKKRKPATLYYDEIRTPTYTDCMNRLFHTLLASNLAGLYHAGGPRRLSLFQIAQIVNRIGGYDPEHVRTCSRFEAGPIPPRAGDVTMDSSRLIRAVGYDPFDPWPLYDEHVPTHHDWHRERPRGERGSPEFLAEVLYQNPKGAFRERP
ncbi:MAG: sugar nucleotide-binding protein [Pirellulaceae bacterium]|jgi:dTDP-4-dehydrorhamnose reductase|nr:sugar nucleotide-binding protein [Pirellulaceae bacterium]